MTSFSYHKTQKKIPNIIFGATFHFSWQDDLSFLSGQGAGRVLCPEVQPLTLLYSIFQQKSYPFHVPSIGKWYHFHMPSLENVCHEFSRS